MPDTPTRETTPHLGPHRQHFTTESLDLAAWLVCQGFPLQRLDPPAQPASTPLTGFVFESSEALAAAVTTWESGQPVRHADLRRYISVKRDLYRRARRVATSTEADEVAR